MYGNFLIRRELSATYAPGGVGKTSLLTAALGLTSSSSLPVAVASTSTGDKCRHNAFSNLMPSADAIEFGIPECERFGYFSTGPSEKTNMTARTGRKTWFRTIGVSVGLRKGNWTLEIASGW